MNVTDFQATKAVLKELSSQILKSAIPTNLQNGVTLPASFEVVQKLPNGTYLIDIGGKQIEAMSAKDLMDKSKYWAQVSKQEGVIKLINVILKPDVLQLGQNHSALEPISLDKLTQMLTKKSDLPIKTATAPLQGLPTSQSSALQAPNAKELKAETIKDPIDSNEKQIASKQALREPTKTYKSLRLEFLERAVSASSEQTAQTKKPQETKLQSEQLQQAQSEGIKSEIKEALKGDIVKQSVNETQVKHVTKETIKGDVTKDIKDAKQQSTNEMQAKRVIKEEVKDAIKQEALNAILAKDEPQIEPKKAPIKRDTQERHQHNVDEVKTNDDGKNIERPQSKPEKMIETQIEKMKTEVATGVFALDENGAQGITPEDAQTYEELKQVVKELGQMPLIFSQADFISQDTLSMAFEIIFGQAMSDKTTQNEPIKNETTQNQTSDSNEAGATKPSEQTQSAPKDTPLNRIKHMVLDEIAGAKTKQDFMILTNVALALNRQIVSMIVEDEDKKRALMQFRKKNKQEPAKQSVEFYGAFQALGPIGGEITLASGDIFMTLECEFENTAKFLQDKLSELKTFDATKVSIKHAKTKELFTLSASLLDLNG